VGLGKNKIIKKVIGRAIKKGFAVILSRIFFCWLVSISNFVYNNNIIIISKIQKSIKNQSNNKKASPIVSAMLFNFVLNVI